MGKGSATERVLANKVWDMGWATLRAPASGGRDRPSPDIVFIRQTYDVTNGIYKQKDGIEVIALELKDRPSGTVTFTKKEINELIEWSERAGAKPYIGVKPDLRKHDQWYFDQPSGLTDSYGFTQKHQESAPGIEELFS